MLKDIKISILTNANEQLEALNLAKTWIKSDAELKLWSGNHIKTRGEEISFPEGAPPAQTHVLKYKDQVVAYTEAHCGKTILNEEETEIWQTGRLICDPQFRHKGYGALIKNACIDYLFKNKTNKIYAFREVENNKVKKLHDKIGFIIINQSPENRNAFLIQLEKEVFQALQKIEQGQQISWAQEQDMLRNTKVDKLSYELKSLTEPEAKDLKRSDIFVDEDKIGSIWFSEPGSQPNHLLLRRWDLPDNYLFKALELWVETFITEEKKTVITHSRFNDLNKRILLNLLGFIPITSNVKLSFFSYMLNEQQLNYSKL